MFIPHTDQDREEMLGVIGLEHLEELFEAVPPDYRFPELDLPPMMSEMEAAAHLGELAGSNLHTGQLATFLGAGAYNHFIPAAVDSILRRGEFYTAYTPYQPEVSQGTLQAIFEYQSLIALLTGMDVANASHYDGATAVAEAVNMAFHVFRGRRPKVVLSPALHPQYRATVRTYTRGSAVIVVGDEAESDPQSGPAALLPLVDDQTSLVVVAYPDFFGRVYDYTDFAAQVHEMGALLAVSINPTALGLLKPPGDFGADIVTGEGQPLGIPLSYGGPYLGLFATRDKYVRKMAGRLTGETTDTRGQRGYVLTLTPREQHIRREKATSNICTNQGLMTLASTVYLSLLGKHGLHQVARLCYDKAHYAAGRIDELPGYGLWSGEPFFHEFVVRSERPISEVNRYLLSQGVLGGYDLGQDFPSLENHMLVAVTETNTRAEIDRFVSLLAEVPHD